LQIKVAACDLRKTIERVWAAGGEIVRVNPVRLSLEDVFLELTSSLEAPAVEKTGRPLGKSEFVR
jgi:hypothetical protein